MSGVKESMKSAQSGRRDEERLRPAEEPEPERSFLPAEAVPSPVPALVAAHTTPGAGRAVVRDEHIGAGQILNTLQP